MKSLFFELSELDRLRCLECAVKELLSEKHSIEDLQELYGILAALVGVIFDPELLP